MAEEKYHPGVYARQDNVALAALKSLRSHSFKLYGKGAAGRQKSVYKDYTRSESYPQTPQLSGMQDRGAAPD